MSKKIGEVTIRIPVYDDGNGQRHGAPETTIPIKIGNGTITKSHPDLDSAVREVRRFTDGNEIKLP